MSAPSPLQRFPIETAEIDALVAAFYREIRAHGDLGPIFFEAIGRDGAAWRAHEAKIAAFWRNAILIDRDYQGNPMRTHMAIEAIEPQHFDQWLALFETVAGQVLPDQTARSITELAHRIGRGLRYGIEHIRRAPSAPPPLG